MPPAVVCPLKTTWTLIHWLERFPSHHRQFGIKFNNMQKNTLPMNAVSVRNLSKKYGDLPALDRVDLEVEAGQLFALVGPNGAGKTTLMRILTTQIEASGGEAYVLGRNVATQGNEVRQLVGYVPQEMSVWTDITGYENLLIYSKIYGLPGSTREKTIRESLAVMDLEGVAGRMVNTYSGGMIRKLEIASAIMLAPKVLFLDEPTIGLDPAARKAVWEKLGKLNRESGTSVFFATHYMDEAENYADTVGILSRGRIVKTGSPEMLKRSVGNERITLELGAPADAASMARIRKIRSVAGVKAAGNSLEISVPDAEHALNSIMALVLGMKNPVKSVSVSKPTLYDAFMKYAGTDASHEKRGRMDELKKTRKRIMSA